jgi:hypothetical protein
VLLKKGTDGDGASFKMLESVVPAKSETEETSQNADGAEEMKRKSSMAFMKKGVKSEVLSGSKTRQRKLSAKSSAAMLLKNDGGSKGIVRTQEVEKDDERAVVVDVSEVGGMFDGDSVVVPTDAERQKEDEDQDALIVTDGQRAPKGKLEEIQQLLKRLRVLESSNQVLKDQAAERSRPKGEKEQIMVLATKLAEVEGEKKQLQAEMKEQEIKKLLKLLKHVEATNICLRTQLMPSSSSRAMSKQERIDSLLKQLAEVEAANATLKGTSAPVRDGKLTQQQMQQIDAIMSNQGSKQERIDSLLKQLAEVEAVNATLKGTSAPVRDGKLTNQERTGSLLKQLAEVEAVNVALKGAVRVRDGKLTLQAGGGGPRARPLA